MKLVILKFKAEMSQRSLPFKLGLSQWSWWEYRRWAARQQLCHHLKTHIETV